MAAEGPKIAEAHIDIVANMEGLRADLAKVKDVLTKVQAPAAQTTSKFVALTAAFSGVMAAVTIVTSAFRLVGSVLKTIGKIIGAIANIIKTVLVVAFNILKKVFTTVFGIIRAGLDALMSGFKRLAGFVSGAIKVQADFGQSMARVAALTNEVGTKGFDVMRQKALDLGKATEFSAGEAADAMGNFAMAGFKTNEILQAVGPTLDFASANQLQLAEASDIAARVMGAMGIEASKTRLVMDALTTGATKTNQNVQDLGEAFKNAGSSARAVGADLHMTTAALMVFADQGERGAQAGSALKQVFLKMPSKNVTKMFSKLGISMTTMDGAMRPMPDLIDDLNKAIAGKGEFEKLNMLTQAYGTRAGPGMIKMLNAGGKAMRDYNQLLKDNSGSTERVATIQRDTLATAFKIVKSAADDLRIAVGDVFEPFIRDSSGKMVGVLNDLAELVRNNTDLMRDKIGDFLDWFDEAWKKSFVIAGTVIGVFWDEIKTGWNGVTSFFEGFVSEGDSFLSSYLGLDMLRSDAGYVETFFHAITSAFTNVVSDFEIGALRVIEAMKQMQNKGTVEFKKWAFDVAAWAGGVAISQAAGKIPGVGTLAPTVLSNIPGAGALDPTGMAAHAATGAVSDLIGQGLDAQQAAREAQGQADLNLAVQTIDERNAALLEKRLKAIGESFDKAGGATAAREAAEEILERLTGTLAPQSGRGGVTTEGTQLAQTYDKRMQQEASARAAYWQEISPSGASLATAAYLEEIAERNYQAKKALQDKAAKEVRIAKDAEAARLAAFLKNLPKRRRAEKLAVRDKRREEILAAGGIRQYLEQQKAGGAPATTSALGAVGTISTMFGQMTVGVTEEIKMLGELVKLTKIIAENSQTAGVVMA